MYCLDEWGRPGIIKAICFWLAAKWARSASWGMWCHITRLASLTLPSNPASPSIDHQPPYHSRHSPLLFQNPELAVHYIDVCSPAMHDSRIFYIACKPLNCTLGSHPLLHILSLQDMPSSVSVNLSFTYPKFTVGARQPWDVEKGSKNDQANK